MNILELHQESGTNIKNYSFLRTTAFQHNIMIMLNYHVRIKLILTFGEKYNFIITFNIVWGPKPRPPHPQHILPTV